VTYNPFIPQPDDYRPPSFVQIQQNFEALNDVFSVDHGAFDDATSSRRGKHTVAQLIPQDDHPATDDNVGCVYIKDVDAIAEDILWYRPNSSGTPIPLLIDGTHTIGGIPGAAAAVFTVTGSSSPFTINLLSSYNVSSVSVSGNGAYITINFTTPMATDNYYPFTGSFGSTASAGGIANVLCISQQTVNNVVMRRSTILGTLHTVLIYGPVVET